MPRRSHAAPSTLAAVALAAILSFASADASAAVDLPTRMTNDEVGFTISYPPSWVVTTYPGSNQVDFDDGPAFLVVDAFPLDILPVREPGAVLAAVAEDLRHFVSNLVVTDLPTRVVGGLDAFGIDYTGTEDGLDVRGTLLVMVDQAYAYMISFEAPVDRFAAHEPTFWAMVASFQRHPIE